MIVFTGSFAQLITGWENYGALGKFARHSWDTKAGPWRGWSYNGYVVALNDMLVPYGGQAVTMFNTGMHIRVEFANPEDYTLFCLKFW